MASSETADRAADAAADAADAAAAATDANQEDIEKEKWRARSADGSGKSEGHSKCAEWKRRRQRCRGC